MLREKAYLRGPWAGPLPGNLRLIHLLPYKAAFARFSFYCLLLRLRSYTRVEIAIGRLNCRDTHTGERLQLNEVDIGYDMI